MVTVAIVAVACSSSTEGSVDSTESTPSVSLSESSPTTSAAEPPPEFTPVLGRVLEAPEPVLATDSKTHLVYELVLTNVLAQPVTLESVEVRSDGDSLLTLDAAELPAWLRVLGSATPGTVLGPGQSGIVWVDVAFDDPAQVPGSLRHVVTATPENAAPPLVPTTLTEDIAYTDVPDSSPVVISPPLRGSGWLDGNGCCAVTPHRGAVNPIGGGLFAAERFAIDYVQLNQDGKMFDGPANVLESYAYFGDEIHAVGDGPVVAVVDGLPEQTAGTSPVGLPVDQYGGNHVVQDLGGGHYAFYAHLKTGSTSDVAVGDELKTGTKVGLLGNSGNTDAPHLHFHVMDGPDPLHANGIPFVFDSFELTSKLAGEEALDQLVSTGGPAAMDPTFTSADRSEQLPLTFDVMTYNE
ncbi:M23 family metallopeptidase [Rhodococcus sp. P1Y]|nr:M23 family metallopeptidase [Rhodococcus sp. P1Y]